MNDGHDNCTLRKDEAVSVYKLFHFEVENDVFQD